MVMRNRSDGSGVPHWWDDLPPKMRDRFSSPLVPKARARAESQRSDDPPQPLGRGELLIGLSRLAALFAVVTVAIILYLLVAVTYVTG